MLFRRYGSLPIFLTLQRWTQQTSTLVLRLPTHNNPLSLHCILESALLELDLDHEQSRAPREQQNKTTTNPFGRTKGRAR